LDLGEVESMLPPQAADIHAATSQVQSGDATSEAVAIAREGGMGKVRRQVGTTGQEERKGRKKVEVYNGEWIRFLGPFVCVNLRRERESGDRQCQVLREERRRQISSCLYSLQVSERIKGSSIKMKNITKGKWWKFSEMKFMEIKFNKL
jgi:hypothetical protein